jgi:hypothetical protein
MHFIKKLSLYILYIGATFFVSLDSKAQELYVNSEPASIMPARSVLIKQSYTAMTGKESSNNFNTQLEFSLSKKWMSHLGTNSKSWEWYTQYRFYSKDAVYEHLRMALFFRSINSSSNAITTNSILLEGQESVLHGGLIITQLKHKWASSLTIGALVKQEALASNGKGGVQYSFSNGLLVYPKQYTSYGQTNVNLYLELIGQTLFSDKAHYVDMAPAIQFIFNSQSKLNLFYRWPLINESNRLTTRSVGISWDYLFFNAIPKHRKKI